MRMREAGGQNDAITPDDDKSKFDKYLSKHVSLKLFIETAAVAMLRKQLLPHSQPD